MTAQFNRPTESGVFSDIQQKDLPPLYYDECVKRAFKSLEEKHILTLEGFYENSVEAMKAAKEEWERRGGANSPYFSFVCRIRNPHLEFNSTQFHLDIFGHPAVFDKEEVRFMVGNLLGMTITREVQNQIAIYDAPMHTITTLH